MNMARDGSVTRNKILDVSQQLLLDQGYGGMSVDSVIEGAGITKGAFFYHFKSKNDLAQALIDRYVQGDDALLHELMGRAESLNHDPLQQYLIFVGLLVERMRGFEESPPGCLIASFVYQMEAFNPETQSTVMRGFNEWQRVVEGKLDSVLKKYKPKLPVTVRNIYDNLISAFEGGIIMGKLYQRKDTLADQIAQHKNYVELLFGIHDDN